MLRAIYRRIGGERVFSNGVRGKISELRYDPAYLDCIIAQQGADLGVAA